MSFPFVWFVFHFLSFWFSRWWRTELNWKATIIKNMYAHQNKPKKSRLRRLHVFFFFTILDWFWWQNHQVLAMHHHNWWNTISFFVFGLCLPFSFFFYLMFNFWWVSIHYRQIPVIWCLKIIGKLICLIKNNNKIMVLSSFLSMKVKEKCNFQSYRYAAIKHLY